MYSNHVSLYIQLVTETRSGSTDAELSRDCIIHGVSSSLPPLARLELRGVAAGAQSQGPPPGQGTLPAGVRVKV